MEESRRAFQLFAGPTAKVDLLYSDGAPELEAAADALGWLHDQSTPDRKQTNGVAERAVKRVLEGSRTSLYQSGLDYCWWPSASRVFCALRCFSDTDGPDGKSAHELPHEEVFSGLLVLCGAEVDYKPAAAKEVQRTRKFDVPEICRAVSRLLKARVQCRGRHGEYQSVCLQTLMNIVST